MPPRRPDTATPTKGDRREQGLLEAAERLLAAGRFEDSSVADLATEAGISRAAFYFYFASKQDLLAATIGAVVSGLELQLTQQFESHLDGGTAEVIGASVRAAADLWWENRVVLRASVELGSALPQVYERNRAAISEVSLLTGDFLARSDPGRHSEDEATTERMVTALVLMTERNFYDLARGDHPRAAYDDLANVLTVIWLRALELLA